MEWDKLLRKRNKTEVEQILVQAIAALSSHPNYQMCTPWEIYELMRKAGLDLVRMLERRKRDGEDARIGHTTKQQHNAA